MNPMFAAGLFDSPWVVAAIVIIGAFINWLSQLRQQKQQRDAEKRESEAPSEPPKKPQGEFDLEETLRRWLGEDAPTPAPPPIPIPRTPSPAPPPVWQGKPAPPVVASRPVATVTSEDVPKVSEGQRQAAARLAQASKQVRQHHASEGRIRRRGGWPELWRDRASARRAFVSSLVYGPPKGLES
ncbi:MAG TPA: hypothetical protein VFZ59_10185 [Verrucomicrobiae bacterium]|nr:hypothetical protein [Verrucomicrobiae bacterium]